MKNKQAIVSEAGRDGGEAERTRAEKYLSPDVDIFETDGEIVVLADVPGADEQSLDITLDNDILRIETKTVATDHGNRRAALIEYGGGPFARSFMINNEINRKGIEAKVSNGVLSVNIPKLAKTGKECKTIPISRE